MQEERYIDTRCCCALCAYSCAHSLLQCWHDNLSGACWNRQLADCCLSMAVCCSLFNCSPVAPAYQQVPDSVLQYPIVSKGMRTALYSASESVD
jgi:hypothetical protein